MEATIGMSTLPESSEHSRSRFGAEHGVLPLLDSRLEVFKDGQVRRLSGLHIHVPIVQRHAGLIVRVYGKVGILRIVVFVVLTVVESVAVCVL